MVFRLRYLKGFMAVMTMGLILCLSLLSLEGFWGQTDNKASDAVQEAILRAAVQCYALEGTYPEDVAYLEAHYGLQLNEEAYYYYYEYLGANIRPTVEVVRKWND